MIALGLDPGSAVTGYGIVQLVGSRLCYVGHGVLRTPPTLSMPDRLKALYEGIVKIITTYHPDFIAVERIYFKQNVTTGISVAQARGVLLLAAAQKGCQINEFSPTEMKTAVTGFGRADKNQIQEMVKRLLSLPKIPTPDDAADALALAICQLQTGTVLKRMNNVIKRTR